QFPTQDWPHLKDLTLADPGYSTPGPIDLIIGVDFYSHIIEEGLIKGSSTSPIAQRIKLGWILSGNTNQHIVPAVSHSYCVSSDNDLYELLQQFWKVEDLNLTPPSRLSKEEENCENHYKSNHARDKEGRYIVRLPLKRSPTELSNSRIKALNIMYHQQKRLSTDPNFAAAYSDFLGSNY
ncbi:PREDICTED: uncharacterized protein LOC108760247, partial [Trachymyrmex cornetzi]|uniref:uncharacterized protein LOC108760247 n=1 Tax=Trachymyrmex cornetzi TaxID=471704 RepID=UPI00084F0542